METKKWSRILVIFIVTAISLLTLIGIIITILSIENNSSPNVPLNSFTNDAENRRAISAPQRYRKLLSCVSCFMILRTPV